MSGRRRRPAVGGGSAEVVSIGTRRVDYSRVARSQITAARQKLGLDHIGLARLIKDMTGLDVLPETVATWEDDVTPPTDVTLACMAAAQTGLGLAMPLLAAVPPSFPAEALGGPWVTVYQFTHAGKPRCHADIAHITAESGSRIRAVNHPPEPRSEGRARSFRNEIEAALIGRHLIGEWRNVSDTRYYGGMQLAVLPGETMMQGYYTGVATDVEVSSGSWRWVRLDPGEGLTGVTLREPSELHDLVMSHDTDAPLTLADVREEP